MLDRLNRTHQLVLQGVDAHRAMLLLMGKSSAGDPVLDTQRSMPVLHRRLGGVAPLACIEDAGRNHCVISFIMDADARDAAQDVQQLAKSMHEQGMRVSVQWIVESPGRQWSRGPDRDLAFRFDTAPGAQAVAVFICPDHDDGQAADACPSAGLSCPCP